MEPTRYGWLAMTTLALGTFGAAAQDDDRDTQVGPSQPEAEESASREARTPGQDPLPRDDDITQAALDVSRQLDTPQHADVRLLTHVVEPRRLDPNPDRVADVALPEGFAMNVFAENLANPRMLAVADDGRVYVTRREVGDVLMLEDTDADGRADVRRTVATRPDMHGIAIDGDTVYLVTVNDIYRARRNDDGTLGDLERLVDDLPDGGQHPNRTVIMGPDGKLYVSVGSTCNACGETSQESATILRVEPDGSSRTIFAAGLRNTIGFGFHPESGELYGMDHGIDWLGDDAQHEELNHIVRGNKYGWPYVYEDGRFNPQDEPPNGISLEEWAEQSTEPLGLYVAHSAPMQLAFYTGDEFPDEYGGDAFVAMRGSWNRNPPSGYEVLRIRFEDGEPVEFEPFATGFLTRAEDGGWGHIGRLAGIAQAADGSLLVSDDTNGVIYRISYEGEDAARAEAQGAARSAGAEALGAAGRLEPTNAGDSEIRIDRGRIEGGEEDTPNELAMEILGLPETMLDVSSPAFGNGRSIPPVYAAEQEDISPPLEWQQGPEETQSYVVIAEDPDAQDDPPHVHWIAYDIPASVTELREGLPGTPRLPVPDGMQQGRNDNGSTGWAGMKPPVGDPAHEYHFQVFALDTMLDLPHGASRAALLDAMDGHVVAAGEIVGTYRR